MSSTIKLVQSQVRKSGRIAVAASLVLLSVLMAADPASTRHHRGAVGLWAASGSGAKETFIFKLSRHGRFVAKFVI